MSVDATLLDGYHFKRRRSQRSLPPSPCTYSFFSTTALVEALPIMAAWTRGIPFEGIIIHHYPTIFKA